MLEHRLPPRVESVHVALKTLAKACGTKYLRELNFADYLNFFNLRKLIFVILKYCFFLLGIDFLRFSGSYVH